MIFRLQPQAPSGVPDRKDPRLLPHWSAAAENPPPGQPWLLDLGGWSPAERASGRIWRWGRREAQVGIDWAGPPRAGELRFTVTSAADAPLAIRCEGRELGPVAIRGGQRQEVSLPCALAPGLQKLTFNYTGRLRRLGRDSRQIGFMVENLEWVPRPE